MRTTIVGLLLAAATAHATTLYHYRSSGQADFIGQGTIETLSSPEAAFTGRITRRNLLEISIESEDGTRWLFWLRGPFGRVPAAGDVYTDTREFDGDDVFPTLDVFGDGRACSVARGRVTVLEMTRALDGTLQSFSADFEQVCDRAGTLHGSIRYHAGDLACAGASDGTPCGDLDACTGDDACIGGECVGTTAPCDDGDACTRRDLCDPRDGVCRGGEPVECADHIVCNGIETCDRATGTCREGSPLVCDDGNACNGIEYCSGDGCHQGSAPLCEERDGHPCTVPMCKPELGCIERNRTDVQCWDVQTNVVNIFRLGDETKRTYRTLSSVFVVHEDGTYEIPGGRCTGGAGPDETGALRARRKGRFSVLPSDRKAMREELRRCAGLSAFRPAPPGRRAWIKFIPDGKVRCPWFPDGDGADLCGRGQFSGTFPTGDGEGTVVVREKSVGIRRIPGGL